MNQEQMKKDLGPGAIFSIGQENTAFAQYFSGECYLNMLTTERVPIGNVTFAPGCRNNWHIHHKGGQILLVTGGRGYYQEWGQPARELRTGDIVNIPPEVKHWHGAAKDSWFQHLAVEVPAEGASNEWLEPVSDEAYDSLK
ncbi:MAG TPA: cupin domain-containing protein [Firmicutes bacterium]|nr:cupin domain-containing protein [Bacillota bacterium]